MPDPTSRNGMGASSKSATFAEKRPRADGGSGPSPTAIAETAALGQQWRLLARLATGVAILTSPVFFLLFYQVLGWGVAPAIIVAALAVFAFRGLFDVLTRRFIPYPGLFKDGVQLKAEDISARRRMWFWRFWWRLAAAVAVVYVAAVVVIYVIDAIQGHASLLAALRAPVDWLGDKTDDAGFSAQIVGFVVTVVLIFLVNAVVFIGPLLYSGIKQIKAYEPGDADWGVAFEDVRGQARPKEEIQKIVRLWQAGERFERAGGKRERGVLFLGAPGTGKTMLSKAIATGFNSPFVSVSGSVFAQTFIGLDVLLVMWMRWRARRLARKWGGQCIIFIDEIDAIGSRFAGASPAQASMPTSLHDVAFYGPMGAINPSGDLVVESEAWRERLFRERAPGRRTLYPAGIQRAADRVRNFVAPGLTGGGMGGLQQLLVTMDGVGTPPPVRRVLGNRINTLLDATYLPPRVGGLQLRIPPSRPQTEQVYFIGATNVPLSWLDPALVRPGRMGRHVFFRTPNRHDRRDIIDLYLGKVARDPELDGENRREELARITMGHSPSMIEQVCSLALTNAHHEGRDRVGWRDLVEAITDIEYGLDTGFQFIPAEARAIAIHEAGHAVTGHLYMRNHMSTRLTITPRSGSAGHHSMGEVEERFAWWQHEQFADLVWGLGAMAAERVFYDETGQGVGGDIAGATWDAALMVGSWGMAPKRPDLRERYATPEEADRSERTLMRRFEQVGVRIMNRSSAGSHIDGDPVASVLSDPAKRAMVAQFLGQAFMQAYWCITHNKAATNRIADILVERRALYGDEVVNLLESLNLKIPEVDPLDESQWPRI